MNYKECITQLNHTILLGLVCLVLSKSKGSLSYQYIYLIFLPKIHLIKISLVTEAMGSDINPWELFLSNTPMDSEIAYRNLFAFTSVKRTADTLHHIQEKRLKDADFELRDLILAGKRQEGKGISSIRIGHSQIWALLTCLTMPRITIKASSPLIVQ